MKKNNLIWIIICNILGALLLGAGWQAPYPPAITDLGWRWTKVSFISLTNIWRRERPLLILSLLLICVPLMWLPLWRCWRFLQLLPQKQC